jgi:hypothetical protein
MGVFVPVVALAAAANVTTPDARFNVYVPSPAIVTMLYVLPLMTVVPAHVVVPGVNKHVADAFSPVPEPSPPEPVTVAKDTELPGKTTFVSGVAVGPDGGATTVGVIVAAAFCPVESAITYLIGVAVPVNVAVGTNVTTPVVVFTVYVPSPVTVSDVPVQLAVAVPAVHNLTVVGLRVAPLPAASPVITSMTCAVLIEPLDVSLSAVGGGGMVGVNVLVALKPFASVMRYEIAVFVPWTELASAT